MALIGTDVNLRGALAYKGERGYSAYEIAVQNGFFGTEQDWIATLGTSSHFTKDAINIKSAEGQTSFDLPEQYTSNSFIEVYINGLKLNENEYSLDLENKKINLTDVVLEANADVEIVVLTISTNSLPIIETITKDSTNETVSGTKALYDYIEDKLKMQSIYNFKGSVNTYSELLSIENQTNGDVYNVIDENKDYVWNESEWIQLGTTINTDELATKDEVNQLKSDIEKAINEVEKTIVATPVTQEADGLMSKEDKIKLDGITEETIKTIILATKPIGTIVFNATGINPSEYLGGTWVAWGSGRVPVGVDTTQTEFATVEKTGGEKTNTLTVQQMPNHTHKVLTTGKTTEWIEPNGVLNYQYTSNEPLITSEFVQTEGGSQPHNNLQPYITCYMWKRTA